MLCVLRYRSSSSLRETHNLALQIAHEDESRVRLILAYRDDPIVCQKQEIQTCQLIQSASDLQKSYVWHTVLREWPDLRARVADEYPTVRGTALNARPIGLPRMTLT